MKIPTLSYRRRARIEIIPLIDIIFFLLATFIMVSTSMIKNLGITVQLPVAGTSAPEDRKDYATVSITESGDIYYNKELISDEQLPGRLRQLKASSENPKVFINADDQAAFGKAVGVLDEARKIGITRVAIETRKPSKS